MSLFIKNNCILPGAFLAGYALHFLNGKVIEFTREKLHINADLYQGLSEEDCRKKYMDQFISEMPTDRSINTHVKIQLFYMLAFAALEETMFRYYLQKRLLPPLLKRVIPRFTNQSVIVISSLSFSLAHLFNKDSTKPQKYALLIHTSLLGLIAAIASEKFSLQAAIAVHVGYNFRSWKRTYFDHFPS